MHDVIENYVKNIVINNKLKKQTDVVWYLKYYIILCYLFMYI